MTWPDVLRALSSDDARSWTMVRYLASGFSPDDFSTRVLARRAMAEALTRTEDLLEDGRRNLGAIRGVRRRLERELWP